MAQNTKTPVMVLQELTVKKNLGAPDYQIVFQQSGTHVNRFDFVVRVAGVQAEGSGHSKQIGKHQAAHNALLKLEEIGMYNPSENPVAAFKVPLSGQTDSTSSSSSALFQPALNCIVELQNVCNDNKLPAPEFVEIASVGPPHNKEFTFECKISAITTQAKASTKKLAKQLAAKEMIDRIKNMLPDIQIEHKELAKALLEKEQEAVEKYQDLLDVVPDKSIKMCDLPNTLVKLMGVKQLSYKDFQEDLERPSEDSLQRIANRLEFGISMSELQISPSVVIISLKLETPFTVIKVGHNYEDAKAKALEETFEIMDIFMQIKPRIDID
ncbi:interferon-inducible double-stranded RNA-dependent protein kinase activator A homolog [Euwallacea fornicatus]|uniref:interferon-inducible double-stranded RNA-dependent protein kinase activator A homolog n=1 Tax=Euwallacea fornicatus TaxID=995702 RepID=UPI00338D71F0